MSPTDGGPCVNTDRELYRSPPGDYYADSIHVTAGGGIGINCGGSVIVRPLREWFRLAAQFTTSAPSETGAITVEVSRSQDGRVFTNINRDGVQLAHLKAGQSFTIKAAPQADTEAKGSVGSGSPAAAAPSSFSAEQFGHGFGGMLESVGPSAPSASATTRRCWTGNPCGTDTIMVQPGEKPHDCPSGECYWKLRDQVAMASHPNSLGNDK